MKKILLVALVCCFLVGCAVSPNSSNSTCSNSSNLKNSSVDYELIMDGRGFDVFYFEDAKHGMKCYVTYSQSEGTTNTDCFPKE